MRRLLVIEFVTLDGVMQGLGSPDEDRDGGFTHGGWSAPYFGCDPTRPTRAGHGARTAFMTSPPARAANARATSARANVVASARRSNRADRAGSSRTYSIRC